MTATQRWGWKRSATLTVAGFAVLISIAAASRTGAAPGDGKGKPSAARPATGEARPDHLYRIRPAETRVSFEVTKLGVFKVEGRFRQAEGKIVYDPAHPEAAQVGVHVQVASLDTSEPDRDDTVRSPDFLDAQRYPVMTFHSVAVKPDGEGKLKVRGRLTIHGVEKEVEVPVRILGLAPGHDGKTYAGFEAELTINRTEFGVLGSRWSGGRALIGDEVKIHLLVGTESVTG